MSVIALIILLILFIPIVVCFLGWIFQLLWNGAVIEAVTVCQPVDYWTAVMLMLFISFFMIRSRAGGSRS